MWAGAAQADVTASPQHVMFEVKFGPYVPHLDDSVGFGGKTPFSDLFGDSSSAKGSTPSWGLLGQGELDYQFFNRFGILGIGISAGYHYRTAKSFVLDPATKKYCDVKVDERGGRRYVIPSSPERQVAYSDCISDDEDQLNVVPLSGGFDGEECLDLAAHWRHASFFAAPTMVRRVVEAARRRGRRPEGLATIVYGGGPMYLADIEEALEVVGPHFAQIYGQGESPMTITVLGRALIDDRGHPRWRERLASVGVAQSMLELSIRDAGNQERPLGEPGEVCVRGEVVMNGYWNDAQATAVAVRDGWLHTGDVGRLDAEGFLTLLDRSKDLVVSGGSNVYPREVEEALLTHPQVAEVAVIGRADPEWGEVVVAYVVAREGGAADTAGAALDSAALDAHCLQSIARFKRPRHYRLVAELPKNHYGKVLKTTLREWEARHLPP